jgi:hypothetical protein
MKAIDLLNQLQDLQKENPAIFDNLQVEFDLTNDAMPYYSIQEIKIKKLFNKLLINLE